MPELDTISRKTRYLSQDPAQRDLALHLYESVAGLPLICPHGHVDPRLFVDPDISLGSPAELLIIPDHYVYRMLYSQGVSLESLGIPRLDGVPVETDHRKIWQTFADHFYLFRGTPTGVWLADELRDVFGIEEKLSSATAQSIYDQIVGRLATPAFRPRALYDQFNVEVLCTTDAATDPLDQHKAIRESGWHSRVLPTFRPDSVINLDAPGWRENIDKLSAVSGIDVYDYRSFIAALENRREFFKSMGAIATDHAALTAHTAPLTEEEAGAIFKYALHDPTAPEVAARFTGHMLLEMARMSVEDGLVMQLHVGSFRDHSSSIYQRFGRDKGADIPTAIDFVHNLRPLLERFGSDLRLTLILFALDESAYSRELAPLAGVYPALKLGPPWWFYDSLNGIRRFFDLVMETTGLYNTVGFNDDTRAFPSIPARHDLWRRASADWVAGLVVRGIVDMEDGEAMIYDLAYGLAKRAYKLT
ncbi:MAG: glucuronate isomerase [Aggregatilineales bacterium]